MMMVTVLLPQIADRADDRLAHAVRVAVGRRATVFEVALQDKISDRTSDNLTFPSSYTWRGMRTLTPRFATPLLNMSMVDVSWKPVRRRALSPPFFGSYMTMWSLWRLLKRSIAASMCLQ